jgi:hypothetical protein
MPSNYECVITGWLEQNQPEPKVVGLSDEQLDSLWESVVTDNYGGTFSESYKKWDKTQTFAAKEIPVGLTDEQVITLVDSLSKLVMENRLGRWLSDDTKVCTTRSKRSSRRA